MVMLGDGIAGLNSLPAGSARLVLSDLPSGETQAKFDEPPDFARLWPAIWRVLPPDGCAVLMASNLCFAAAVVASQPKTFRYEMIWKKSVKTGFLNAKKRPLREHEYILVFSRKVGPYYPQMQQGRTPIHAATRHSHGENYGPMTGATKSRGGATDRYPGSVIEIGSIGTSSKARVHPQQKPPKLWARCIRTYSEPGTLVVDPYAGSGTAEEAALAEERRFVGWDSDPRFGSAASLTEA